MNFSICATCSKVIDTVMYYANKRFNERLEKPTHFCSPACSLEWHEKDEKSLKNNLKNDDQIV